MFGKVNMGLRGDRNKANKVLKANLLLCIQKKFLASI